MAAIPRKDMIAERVRGFASADITTAFSKIPIVDLAPIDSNPAEFFAGLRYSMSEVGFMLLSNAPGFEHVKQSMGLKKGSFKLMAKQGGKRSASDPTRKPARHSISIHNARLPKTHP